MVTKKELQKRCKAAGISQNGNCTQMELRLKAYKERGKGLPKVEKGPTCDAILLAKAMIGTTENDMKQNASDALKSTLDDEEMEVRNVRGELFAGNAAGLGLAGVPQRVHLLETQVAALIESNAALTQSNTVLTDYVSILRLAGPDYKRVRNRFLTVYKRDGLKETLTPSDVDVIQQGNVTAHSGDVTIDALLYDGTEGRRDSYVFQALYGLHPTEAKLITHDKTIEVLNLHAALKADKLGTDEFYRRFSVFMGAYNRSDPLVNYLAEGPTNNKTCAAYWSLLECEECKGLSKVRK